MQHSVIFLQPHFESLVEHLFSNADSERAVFLLARQAVTANSISLLVRKVIPVANADIISASRVHMAIRSRAYLSAMKQADLNGESFIFVHSHPSGFAEFSAQDDDEEVALFKTAFIRIHHNVVHASLVFTDKDTFCGRVRSSDGTHSQIKSVRIVGNRFQQLYSEPISDAPLEYFDRQARAFTADLQPILKRLHIGIVGVGGTGSAVCEQLIRLGVGKLTIIDGGTFEKSNVNRVYGSTVFDEKLPKVNILARLAATVGLGTEMEFVQGHLSFRSVTRRLLDCDIIFGCTDDEWGRSILNRLALQYYIPVFDMGVNIDTDQDKILSIQGRVTTLLPGAACLYCRKRISSDRVRAESIAATNPEEAARLRKEGYLVNIDEPAPSVVSFTTGIAAMAVSEFLHRLTGFQGSDRKSTEVIYLFDQSRIRTNSTAPSPDCLCADVTKWGTGDTRRFLDLNWREK
jgi:molybdopterin/thiamine biosynthesis adenylyltransferase